MREGLMIPTDDRRNGNKGVENRKLREIKKTGSSEGLTGVRTIRNGDDQRSQLYWTFTECVGVFVFTLLWDSDKGG